MENSILKIFDIIKGYRNHDNIFISKDDIKNWALQFGVNAEFILSEFAHILPNIYISKEKAKLYIKTHLNNLFSKYKEQYPNTTVDIFLKDTLFFDTQADGKSQKAILSLLDEILIEKNYFSYTTYLEYPKSNFVYFDDILATGGTFRKEIIAWLKNQDELNITNYKKISDNKIKITACFFCTHSWAQNLINYELIQKFGANLAKNIHFSHNISIENHLKQLNQQLNIAIPIHNQSHKITDYLDSIRATNYADYAYREDNQPINETFFSSPENRIKYENIILEKGIELIEKIEQPKEITNIRPLGFVYPNYKTFGLGTHFFTWRNIPNNTPLVFWWEVPKHDWKPLFPLYNRGIKY